MPIERAVVNASPLITLFNSKLADLLPQLFGTVQIPPAVWQEVTATKADVAAQTLPGLTWGRERRRSPSVLWSRLGIWVLANQRC